VLVKIKVVYQYHNKGRIASSLYYMFPIGNEEFSVLARKSRSCAEATSLISLRTFAIAKVDSFRLTEGEAAGRVTSKPED
jgi:hypothetical protein